MHDVAGKGAFSRYFEKGLTADTIGGYLASVQGLHELLKVFVFYFVLKLYALLI